ncbi:type II toxin-antitoxin system MqsA family antitoxin [Myxococcus sp. SDU36]|uniref:type II toxin-antitoxin system MqsA family antitoxin n=1 Tax=Myxococcus sp. SDU36 TaxID=2831967 RepID=UPI002542EBC8|nr:type II toxin-antitoxin system MqsA family antitoxin [Myxococcus sp. SDU36]WIG94256.1 type II toxin-antitoxin system MqsA family antitoxin [Myxococcus sp. SDU36]
MKCESCGGELLETRLDSYHFDESGLEDVILVGVVERRCEKCDEREVVIPKLKELHRTIAKALAAKNSLLTPSEVRFLRKHLGFSQADFAKRINVRSEAVSRWETGAEEFSWHFELLLRLMVMLELHERNYTVKSFDEVQEKRLTAPVRIFAEKSAWRPDSTYMLTSAC